MKLRISGNALRLRLSEKDLTQLADNQRVENALYFGDSALTYTLEMSDDSEIFAIYGGDAIIIFLPRTQALAWLDSDNNGLEHLQPLANGGVLKILIEKDLPCKHS